MIQIENLRVSKNGSTICRAAELSVQAGERIGIYGANGSGKTTLLRVIAGLERDFQGRCQVTADQPNRIYVHQNPYLFRGTVLRNVTYGLRARGVSHKTGEEHARAWMEKLGIAALAGRRVNHLSGGERRRTALVRALVLRPPLLLLDEPLAEMDAEGEAQVIQALGELENTTVLIASPAELPDGLVSKRFVIGRPD